MTKERLTIFDADRTLFHGPSTEWALKDLARAGLLKKHEDILEALDRLKNPEGDQVPYISEAGRVFARVVGDVPEAALKRTAAETAEVWRMRIFAEMKPEIAEAQERGPFLIISHGPDAFIRPFAELIGAQGAHGRTPEDYILRRKPAKQTMASLACEEAGIELVWNSPASHTTVYGDAEDDLHLLRQASVPILVNPMTPAIREEGEASGWRIIDCENINQFGAFGYLEGAFAAKSH